MKKTMIALLVMIGMMTITQSCEENGPTSHAEYPDWSSDELMSNIIEASNTGQLLYKCDVKLYYRNDGEWYCYGSHAVYNDPNARADQADYVLLGEDNMIPVEHVDRFGYHHRVRYMGVDLYY